MNNHETDAPAWSRQEYEHDAEAEPIVLAEEDVVVIESHDASDEPGDMPYETPAHEAAQDEAVADETAADAVPPEPMSDSAVPEAAVPEAAVPEATVPEPAVAESEVPESVAPGLASEDTAAVGGTTTESQSWSEIKAMFVDDPGESVKLASGLVERAIDDLVNSLRDRQGSLASWEAGDGSDTEGLRNVLRSYRSLFEQLEGMSGQFGSEKARAAGS
jgi:hypothetical protein